MRDVIDKMVYLLETKNMHDFAPFFSLEYRRLRPYFESNGMDSSAILLNRIYDLMAGEVYPPIDELRVHVLSLLQSIPLKDVDRNGNYIKEFRDSRFSIMIKIYGKKIAFYTYYLDDRNALDLMMGSAIAPLDMSIDDYIKLINKKLALKSVRFLYEFQRSKYSFSKWLRIEIDNYLSRSGRKSGKA